MEEKKKEFHVRTTEAEGQRTSGFLFSRTRFLEEQSFSMMAHLLDNHLISRTDERAST
jgi:hypothetical protein